MKLEIDTIIKAIDILSLRYFQIAKNDNARIPSAFLFCSIKHFKYVGQKLDFDHKKAKIARNSRESIRNTIIPNEYLLPPRDHDVYMTSEVFSQNGKQNNY